MDVRSRGGKGVKIVTVVGNPQAASRSLAVATALGDRLAGVLHGAARTIDLAAFAVDLVRASVPAQALVAEVRDADLVISCSPTYKATYTGLLKCFWDLFPSQALAGRVAVPVMTGASSAHTLAGDVHMRPLLVELGASVPTGALYFTMDRMPEMDTVLDEWVSVNSAALGRHCDVETGWAPS
jgi:FMN reductase